MEEWRLIDLDIYNGFMNMAIDEAILEARIKGLVPNTIRFYRWNPSAVSIGVHQSIYQEVNLEACKRLGVDVVRRITGGGAVYHDFEGEITYSVVVNENHKAVPSNVADSFVALSKGLIYALNRLGLNAHHGVLHCPSIFIGRKKISGNAQARRRGFILQHGTLLLKVDADKMFTVLKIPPGKTKERMVRSVHAKVTSIYSELKHNVDFNEIRDALVEGFEKALNIKLIPEKLTSEELKLAKELKETKYSKKEWNFKF